MIAIDVVHQIEPSGSCVTRITVRPGHHGRVSVDIPVVDRWKTDRERIAAGLRQLADALETIA